jgi:3-hydroxybutyryl-CoA dehydrogenase
MGTGIGIVASRVAGL